MSQSRLARFIEYTNQNWFPGCNVRTLKHHYSLLPVFGCMVVGWVWAGYFGLRTMIINPDSTLQGYTYFNRYKDGTYFKFFNFTGLKLVSQAPEYRREGDPTDEEMCLPDW